MTRNLSRRSFMKVSGLISGVLVSPLGVRRWMEPFPTADQLGRVNVGKVERKLLPDVDSQTVDVLYQDAVVPWLRELVGVRNYNWINQRWVETPGGYIYSPHLQPVKNLVNPTVGDLVSVEGGQGFWAEVTVPFVDIVLANPPARSFWLQQAAMPRLYYSQVAWVDQLREEDGQVWYRVNERYGSPGDIFWVPGEALRPIEAEEIAPINPHAEQKRVRVNVTDQTMGCYEDGVEVYFCQISTGYQLKGKWETPIGAHPIWRKLISLHMSGGSTGVGWDLAGVGWTSLFVGNGVAIHSTFWHNDFGAPRSHGCVNTRPEDAKWVFRWSQPAVAYDPGDITVSMPGGTVVEIYET